MIDYGREPEIVCVALPATSSIPNCGVGMPKGGVQPAAGTTMAAKVTARIIGATLCCTLNLLFPQQELSPPLICLEHDYIALAPKR